MADLGGSAVFVVGDDFYDKSGFSGAESFVGQFFQSNIAEFSATALNRPLNVVFGHVNGAGAVNGDAERKIHFRVAALARGNRDDVGDFGKNRTAFGVYRRFLPFGRRPFGMAGHKNKSLKQENKRDFLFLSLLRGGATSRSGRRG